MEASYHFHLCQIHTQNWHYSRSQLHYHSVAWFRWGSPQDFPNILLHALFCQMVKTPPLEKDLLDSLWSCFVLSWGLNQNLLDLLILFFLQLLSLKFMVKNAEWSGAFYIICNRELRHWALFLTWIIIKLWEINHMLVRNNPQGGWNLRANVTNDQTFGGNSWKINFVHISKFSKSQWEINHRPLRLAEYRFIFEKIDNNWIPLLKLKISGESRSVVSQTEKTWIDKKYQTLKTSIKIYFVSNLSNLWRFIYTI